MPGKELVPKALQIHPDNPQINIGDRTRGPPTENDPHIVTTSPLEILDTPKNNSKDDELEIIAWVSQRDEPLKTSTMSTSDIKPILHLVGTARILLNRTP